MTVPLAAVVDRLVGTFGPFLVPATLFSFGVVGYPCLYAIEQVRGDDWSGGA